MPGPYEGTYEESVSNVTATNSVQLGSKREYGGNTYRYVYNNGTTQASPGFGVIISGLSGWSVTVSSITESSPFVGVVVHTTLTTATYGWVLTKGLAKVEIDLDQDVVTAQKLYAGPDGVFQPVTNTTAFSQSSIPVIQGYTLGTTASAGSVAAIVHCFGS